MDCIIQLLGVFANAVTVLQMNEYLTNSMKPLLSDRLHQFVARRSTLETFSPHIRAAAFEMFKDFGALVEESTDLRKIAAFCHPRAKKLKWERGHTKRTYRELTKDAMVVMAVAAEGTAARPAADTAGGPQSGEAGRGTGGSKIDTGRGSRAAAASQTRTQAEVVEVRNGRRSKKTKPNLFADFLLEAEE